MELKYYNNGSHFRENNHLKDGDIATDYDDYCLFLLRCIGDKWFCIVLDVALSDASRNIGDLIDPEQMDGFDTSEATMNIFTKEIY